MITAVGPPGSTGRRPPVYVMESAPWVGGAQRRPPLRFAAFTVDPGSRPGGPTALEVTYYDVTGPDGRLAPFERFTLRRPRRD